MTSSTSIHRGVWALAVTAFAIGVAEFIVVGILPSIADGFKRSLAQVGGLVGLYAFALALGTPVIVLLSARCSRKRLLLGLVALFLVGNLVSAVANSYALLLAGRLVTAVAHGSFFAIGATVAARLAPPGQASRAIALMFAGLTLAMVIGVPLGSFIGNHFWWRLPFYAVALLAAVALASVARWVPDLPAKFVSAPKEALATFTQLPILAMMSATILGFGSSFAAFTFITPILVDITGFSSSMASVLLVVFGSATLVGNLLGGALSARWGWATALRRLLIGLLIVLIALAMAMPYRTPMVIVLFLWGVLAFGMSPGFQAGMLETAERWAPRAVDFASALNISAFNLGIALGETLGSLLVAHNHMDMTPWIGLLLVALAQLPLAWLAFQHQQLARA